MRTSVLAPPMTGITFFGTRDLEAVVAFYVDRLGASVWLEQPDCTVLEYDTQLLHVDRHGIERKGHAIDAHLPDRNHAR